MKKRIISMLFAIILCLSSFAAPAFAAETGGGRPVGGGGSGTTFNDTESSGNPGSNLYVRSAEEALGLDNAKPVTTDDVNNWVDRKGGEIVQIVVRVVQFVAIVGFLVSLVCIIVGAVGNKRTMVGGIIGLIAACAAFTAATCSSQIILAVSTWLRA